MDSADIVLPDSAPEWASDRAALWNAAEQSETRKNSTVAREWEVALPHELPREDRKQLALDFAKELVQRYGFVADVAIHKPGKEGDNRNHHAHILCSTRRLTPDGFGEKTRELDAKAVGPKEVEHMRERWAELGGNALERAGFKVEADRYRVGHLPMERQIEAARGRGDTEFVEKNEGRVPTRHLGPAATAIERRTGEPSRRRSDFDLEATERLARAKEVGQLERESKAIDRSIIDLSGDLTAAKAERDREREKPKSRTDELYAQLEARRGAQIDGQQRPGETAGKPDWSKFANVAGSRGMADQQMPPKPEPQREPAGKPDWSKFQSVAGTRATEDQQKGKAMEPQNGPQYFPQSKDEKARNRDEAGALHRIEQQRKDQEQPAKSRTNDLWDQMERDRQAKEQQEREKDSGRDFDM